ncbi:Cytochrome P450 82C4 [Nymphaea thermarum]|nr:Cytochrome P450 82C4 [Nymphaea thermarum]
MESLTLVAEGLAALLAFFFIRKIWQKSKSEGRCRLPEPNGSWPIVGHLGLLTGTTPLYRTLATLSEKHGPLFSLQLGQRRAIVVSSMDLAKECFTVNDRAFAGRPPLESFKRLGYDHAMFAFSPYGPYYRELRKIVTTELLSSQQLELLKHIRVDEVGFLVRRLYGSCSSHEPVEMMQHVTCLALNIVLRMVAGKRYFDLDGEGKEFSEALNEFGNLGTFTISDAIPWLRWLDVGGHLKAMKRVHLKMDEVASAWLAEHRRKESSSAGGKRDLIDVLIKELDDGHLSENHQTDTIIKATVLVLVVAGTEATAITLEWALSLLLNNPHLLKKAQDELDCQVGKDRQVDESDINNLPYLQAIVKESMRLYPATPLLLPHESMEPVQLGGFEVPVGSTLFVNAWKIHRDPTLWTDPEEFKPERFLSSSNEMTSFGGQDFAFLPFGSGRRFCIGWRMAMQVLHLTLARLLQGFEWSTPMDEPVDMTEGHGLALPKATPLTLPSTETANTITTSMDSIKLVGKGLAALLAVFFICKIWQKKKKEARCRLPEPTGSWPIVGHLGLQTGTTPLYRSLAALSKKHGPLFSLQLGQRRVIVVGSMALAKECFTVNDRAFAGRPPLEGWKRLGYDCAMFAFSPYGPYFRELRKIVAIKLLSSQQLELLKHIRVDEVGSFVRRLYGSCSNHELVEMKQHLNCLALNIVLRMVARKRYVLDHGGKEFSEALDEFVNLLGTFTVSCDPIAGVARCGWSP